MLVQWVERLTMPLFKLFSFVLFHVFLTTGTNIQYMYRQGNNRKGSSRSKSLEEGHLQKGNTHPHQGTLLQAQDSFLGTKAKIPTQEHAQQVRFGQVFRHQVPSYDRVVNEAH